MSFGPANKKQYGLIIPKSNDKAPIKKRPISSVFNVDSDEESEASAPSVPVHLQRNSFKGMKRQAKIDIQRALEDDPSVYQYDEIYDSMKEDKQKKITLAKQDKTSKYAKNLIRNAAIRKLENDRHFERQCQKELEDEGDEFADKEAFITSSYKNKLAELAVLEEEHKRMAEEEKKNDVTKKRDLTEFYRNILQQRTADVASSVAKEVTTPASSVAKEVTTPASSVAKEVTTPASSMAKEVTTPASSVGKEAVVHEVEPSRTGPQPVPGRTESDPTEPCCTEPQADPGHKPGVIKKIRSDKRRTYRAKLTSDHAHHQSTDSGGESSPDSGLEDGDEERNTSARTETNVPENLDKDDSDSSDSEEESGDEKKSTALEEEDGDKEGEEAAAEKPRLVMTEAEEKEERMKLIRETFKKRNTPETVQSAIERYWKRQSLLVS